MAYTQTVQLTNSSSSFPVLGLGTWKSEPESVVEDVIYKAIKLGYRHIDCAAVYGNEVYVGRGIKRAINEGIVKRSDLWITSKLWNTNHAKEHVEPALRRTLNDLDLEYLDLYLVHFPIALEYVDPNVMYPALFLNKPNDPEDRIRPVKVPFRTTWESMEELCDKNLTKNIGVSNVDLQLLQDILTYCRIKPLTNQIEVHPYLQQNNMIRFCRENDISITAYSSFGGISYVSMGMASADEVHVLKNPVILEIAAAKNKTPAQIVLRWLIQLSPNVVVVPKTVSEIRLVENAEIFDFELTETEMDKIKALNKNKRYNDPMIYTDKNGRCWPIFS